MTLSQYICVYHAPFGAITLVFNAQQQLLTLHLHELDGVVTPLPITWRRQLDDYFSGRLNSFHHPISTQGSAFEQRVWQAIANIPAGEIRTYQSIANALGSHPRAVGRACAKNPLPLVVPCHRVVAKRGLGGFSSGGDRALMIKRWLLRHEGAQLKN